MASQRRAGSSKPCNYEGDTEKTQAPRLRILKRVLTILGPGFITGASDDDPSGIGTYSTAGASLGYATLWTALFTFPLMAIVQYTCAKVGLVSKRGLAGILKRHYAPWVLYSTVFGLVFANTLNAGADIGAIAAALNMLVPIPIVLMIVPITLLILLFQVWGSYRVIANVFRWLALALLAYLAAAFFARPDWGEVLRGTFLPVFHLDSSFVATLVAILGTTISPYLFFWQTDQEVEEEKSLPHAQRRPRKSIIRIKLWYAAWDVNIGMVFSNIVMYFIILATAATLFKAGRHDIRSATDAAQALRPIAGSASSALLAVGLIGSGLLAVPILTGSAAYAVAEAFGWKYGFEKTLGQAKPFYAIMTLSTLLGMLINFVGINPIAALFWAAVINGVLAPPLLVLMMLISTNTKVMGDQVNGPFLRVGGWLAALVMGVAALALFATLLTPPGL